MPKFIPKQTKSKPKILLALYDICDLGGIINWVEHLCHGFNQLGVEFKLVRLETKQSVQSRQSSVDITDLSLGHTGLYYDQRAGWRFPTENRVALLSTDWVKYTSAYDLVVWVVPVPSKKNVQAGWQSLYDINKPQVMVIHDGNLNKMYPHAYDVMDKCVAVAGVHDCAYGSVDDSKLTKCIKRLIPNAQIPRPLTFNDNRSLKSKLTVFSLQTFKRWKRVDDLVRAVPYIKNKVVLAGGGIEYYYMTSSTKRKPCYGDIWEKALENDMDYLGYINEAERDLMLRKSRLLIDSSWSKGYSQYGSHFNRVFVDAVLAGCLPACRDLLMDGNSFFSPDDYVTIPYDVTPKEYAEVVNSSFGIGEKEYYSRIKNLRECVDKHFNSLTVAGQYLEFLK